MKVLMLNGSCKKEGNTYNALLEIGKQLEKEGIDYEIFQTGSEPVRDCIGCGGCASGKCVYTDDAVNEFVEKARTADGFVFGTPVYYAHPSDTQSPAEKRTVTGFGGRIPSYIQLDIGRT